jgi:intracellular septation protein
MENKQPSWLKPVVEFGPLVVFFVSYKFGGFMVSTASTIVATILAAVISYAVTRKIPPMLWVTLVVVVVFGGLSLATGNKTFFFMKPTIVMALFAVVLFGGLIAKKPLLKSLMGSAMELDDSGWWKLTLRFALFFAAVAIANEIVWRTQSEETWATFKAFGILGLNVLFILTQLPLIMRHQVKQPGE